MALFTSKDDALKMPSVTQFYQIDVDDKAELETWVERMLFSGGPAQQEGAASLISDADQGDLRRLQHAVRAIMDAAADRKVPDGGAINAFNAWRGAARDHPPALVWFQEEEGSAPIVYEESQPAGFGRVSILIAHIVVEELARSLVEGKIFARCEECSSSFLMIRPDQKYCSRRHGNNARERARYAVLFAEYRGIVPR